VLSVVMLNANMLSAVMLNIFMLSIVMLRVVALITRNFFTIKELHSDELGPCSQIPDSDKSYKL
jgi:hypothetical protein